MLRTFGPVASRKRCTASLTILCCHALCRQVFGPVGGGVPARRLRLPPSVFKQLSRTVLPLVETWVGAGQGMIECTSTGEDTFVQEFQRGAAVRPHVHDIDESVLTAVINIAQIGVSASGSRRPRVLHRCQSGIEFVRALAPVLVGMDEQWPIRVNDHSGKQHELYLAPGDILLRVTMPPPPPPPPIVSPRVRPFVMLFLISLPMLRHSGTRAPASSQRAPSPCAARSMCRCAACPVAAPTRRC